MNIILSPDRRAPLHETPISTLLGDEVRVNFSDALELAYQRTADRGCKQQVRASRDALGRPTGYWMIQEVR